ncbi:G-protein coupled receptor daf-37-like [Hydra vulgaris]|uniref:G-protein coupled receptor daf-37-like n=1 Tax=Hydra vulgaris TaxID=6087 RepID=A0ABM4BN33_HYDVU
MTLFPSLQDESYIYATFYCYFGSPFYSIFIIASAWLIVAVTLNRFLMIILPLKARSLCSPNRVYWSIFGLIIFSLVINIPQFLIFKTIRVNETKVVIVTTTFGSSKNFELWLHCIFALLTPWILIAVLNTIVIYYLSVQRKELERMNDDIRYESKLSKKSIQQLRENQVTRTLLVVTFTYLVFLGMQCILKCLWIFEIEKDVETGAWEMFYEFCKLSLIINSSINSLLYCFTGTLFRNELKRMFGCKAGLRRGSTTTNTRNTEIKKQISKFVPLMSVNTVRSFWSTLITNKRKKLSTVTVTSYSIEAYKIANILQKEYHTDQGLSFSDECFYCSSYLKSIGTNTPKSTGTGTPKSTGTDTPKSIGTDTLKSTGTDTTKSTGFFVSQKVLG